MWMAESAANRCLLYVRNIALKAWNFSNLEPKEFLRTTVYS